MNEEILAIRAELHQSDARRGTLFRRLNVLQSRTSVLPPEMLSLIFQHFCASCEPPTKYRLPPILLGSVSHAWRQVAWLTPQLWVSLFIRSISDVGRKRSAELLALYLANARNISITVSISFFNDYSITFKEDPIAQVFFGKGGLEKVDGLTLYAPPIDWLHSLNDPFSRLVKFCLVRPPSLTNIDFLKNTPTLREISFEGLSAPPKALSPLITTLTLKYSFFAVAAWFLLGFRTSLSFT